ncbi:hypothetical protein BJX64DRAFT_27855 [Aspergillus heterothallicus]
MNEPFGYDDQDSPGGLKPIKPDLRPRDPTPPPFVQTQSPVRGEGIYKDKDFLKPKPPISFGQADANAALLRHTIALDRPEIVDHETRNPIAIPPPVDFSFFRSTTGLTIGRNHTHDVQTKRPPEPDLGPKLPPIKVPNDSPREKRLSLITDPLSQDSLPAILNPSTSRPGDHAGTRLPSLKTQLGGLGALPPPPPPSQPASNAPRIVGGGSPFPLPPVSAVSPPMIRAEPSPWDPHRGTRLSAKLPPSPYNHHSPASSHVMSAVSSPVSQSAYWRGGPKSAGPYYESPSIASRSPATNYPTPTEHAPPGSCEPVNYVSPQGSVPPAPAGTFKCDHPGCNAAPFQTQYLLNSHANVHSQDRPHFCPIEGCTRGPGGKGFKRKNEMIRHGLVHNSPGYVCPFCPDQQHKYPRPDNLQRHVRVHHVDKSKDDAALRHVLAQRPEGSGRGRRRRINPQ